MSCFDCIFKCNAEPEELYEKAYRLYYSDYNNVFYYRALSNQTIKRIRNLYLKTIEKDPNHMAAHYELGVLYWNRCYKTESTAVTYKSNEYWDSRHDSYQKHIYEVPYEKKWDEKMLYYLTKAIELGHPKADNTLRHYQHLQREYQNMNAREEEQALQRARAKVEEMIRSKQRTEQYERDHPELAVLKQIDKNQCALLLQNDINSRGIIDTIYTNS